MAAPKKRTSCSRRDKRRSHHALSIPRFTTCSNCGAPVRTHHLCKACGFYRGKQIVSVRVKKEKDAA